MREDRLQQMEQYIYQKGNVSIADLCKKFGISPNTARRDINGIISRTNIRKVYGGVTAQAANPLPDPFVMRQEDNIIAKETIGRLAATLVEDGDTIYVDAGTTACNLIDYLDDKKDLTIVTHSLEVINKALNYPNLTVIAMPGLLDRHSLSLIDTSTINYLENYHFKKAFMGTTGLSVSNGATQPTVLGCAIKKMIIAHSAQIYMMTETSKIGKISLMTFCPLKDIDAIVFEKAPPKAFLSACSDAGCTVITPDSIKA